MRIRFTWAGKTRDASVRSLVGEYVRRIARLAEVEVIELRSPPADRGQGGKARFLHKEGQSILKTLEQDHWVGVLDVAGEQLTTEGFAALLNRQAARKNRILNLVVGGAMGLAEELRARADFRLALSPMTFPHDLVRVLIAEQVYRSLTLLCGQPYHY